MSKLTLHLSYKSSAKMTDNRLLTIGIYTMILKIKTEKKPSLSCTIWLVCCVCVCEIKYITSVRLGSMKVFFFYVWGFEKSRLN